MSVTAEYLYSEPEEVDFLSPRDRLRRGGGWLAAFLTLVMLSAVAWAVQAADWSDGLGLVETAIFGGTLLGFVLALTNWDGFFAAIYSLLACVAWVTNLLVHSYLRAPDLHTGILQIFQRSATWGTNLATHQPSADNLIFVLQLLLLGWWMGYFAIWMVFRHHQVWLAAVPPGIGLMVNAYYSPKPLTGYLLLFLLVVLLLAIRVELARNEIRWQLAHVRYAPDIYVDFLRDGLVFALVVVAVTWLMPVGTPERRLSMFEPINDSWHDMQQTWNQAFTSLRYPATGQVTTFGKSLTLGGPVSLTDRPIFEAQATERVYWRASVFDTYNGHQWLNTDSKVMTVDQNRPLPEPDYAYTKDITATVRTLEVGQDVLFTPPQPIRASLPVNIDYNPVPGQASQNSSIQAVAVSLLRSRVGLAKDSVYQIEARPSGASPDLLRTVADPYPAAITQRYLQVPDSLPARVRDLALQLTRPYDNAYDKATAIEAYVRSFPYNNQIAAPPPGQDGVDYFLFNVKEGYCDYYASAMAMMLRVAGVPARFVVGYTPGADTTQPGTYLVREENAHAWVEAYFPQYGWVQFEPTASQPLLERPAPLPVAQQPTPEPQGTPGPIDRPDRAPEDAGNLGTSLLGISMAPPANPVLRWLFAHQWQILGVLVLAALAFVGRAFYRRQQRRLLHPDGGLIARLFDLLPGWANRLHIPWPASHTPLEHAQTLATAVPEAALPAGHLAQLFVAQRYGRQELEPEALDSAAGDWRAIHPALWRSWLRNLVPFRARRP